MERFGETYTLVIANSDKYEDRCGAQAAEQRAAGGGGGESRWAGAGGALCGGVQGRQAAFLPQIPAQHSAAPRHRPRTPKTHPAPPPSPFALAGR